MRTFLAFCFIWYYEYSVFGKVQGLLFIYVSQFIFLSL